MVTFEDEAPMQQDDQTHSRSSNPTSVSDLIFSSSQANHQFNKILGDLKKSNLSIHNRLRSVQSDADFAAKVSETYNGRPLVANERCGSWYIPPASKRGSAYFKSTDGHFGIWMFSTRRLNLQLLKLIGENDGCIVVDSTRRGKRMPDALSKTVPTWCCVLNHVLFPESSLPTARGDISQENKDEIPRHHKLYTPPNAVSESENAQMSAKIAGHVAALRSLGLDLEPYRKLLKKPLRPVWVTQESHLMMVQQRQETIDVVFEDFHPVICCTTSRRVVGGEMSEGGYIQGAGDDTENWAFGLTPPVFWANADLLFATPEGELPNLIRILVEGANIGRRAVGDDASSLATNIMRVAPGVSVGKIITWDSETTTAGGDTISEDEPCTIILQQSTATDPSTWIKSKTRMEVGLGGKQSKIASRNLRAALLPISDFVRSYLEHRNPPAENSNNNDLPDHDHDHQTPREILIACDTGRDLCVGVALSILCQHCVTEDGSLVFRPRAEPEGVNKTVIKSRLGHIMTMFPDANPSRTTLQSINNYLMG